MSASPGAGDAATGAVGASATAETFRLRRISIVDTWWYLGFITAFALSGILAFGAITDGTAPSATYAIVRYIVTICLWGLVGGVIGVGAGHGIATWLERRDLRRNPRRYEQDPEPR
jgi:hypothetical protein